MSGSSALGTFAANEKHRYQFTVSFNSAAGQRLSGRQLDATFQWNAVQ